MQDTVDASVIISVYAVLIGAGWAFLIDPLRPASSWIAAVSVVLTGFLVIALVPEAVMSTPLLVVAFSGTAFVRDRVWRRGLIPKESTLRMPPPPAPSASANE